MMAGPLTKGRATNARNIGKELGVAYLLEGSVQKAGNRLRIIVQLIETEGGAHFWSSRFDGAIDDFFDFEDRITEQVAGALRPSIRIAEIERSRRKRPQDLGSCDYTMRAMPHVRRLRKKKALKRSSSSKKRSRSIPVPDSLVACWLVPRPAFSLQWGG
jgi:adenylate cyclase